MTTATVVAVLALRTTSAVAAWFFAMLLYKDGKSATVEDNLAVMRETTDGFEIARFGERTGLPLSAIERPLAEAERRGLIERDLQRVRPTPLGFDFLNDLQQLFLPAPR